MFPHIQRHLIPHYGIPGFKILKWLPTKDKHRSGETKVFSRQSILPTKTKEKYHPGETKVFSRQRQRTNIIQGKPKYSLDKVFSQPWTKYDSEETKVFSRPNRTFPRTPPNIGRHIILEDTQVWYILQKYTLDKYTLEKYT